MESDDTTDAAESQDFSSETTNAENTEQSKQCESEKDEQRPHDLPESSTVCQSPTKMLLKDTERSTALTGDDTLNPERISPEVNKRSTSPTGDDQDNSESNQLVSGRRLTSPIGDDNSNSERKSSEVDRRSISPTEDDHPNPMRESPEAERSSELNDMEVFKHPLCLVSTDRENKLKIEEETAEQIKKIDLPIVVVAVVGLYRTGKSYLMNRLAGSGKGCFALGNTIEAKTKGIWVWCRIHPRKPNTVMILLDTEGLAAVSKGDSNHDNRIFTVATLLCNCLVYNMKGIFDEDAVSKLTFITEMAKNIRCQGQSSEDDTMLSLVLPDFVLCLRDFNLELSKNGKAMTEDEYLQDCLQEENVKDEHFNKPRECIRKFFQNRRCFTFPVPGGADVLKKLETLEVSGLSPEFNESTDRFTSYIYSCQPKRLFASKPINGQMLTTLADHYITALRHGAVPDVDDAFSAAAKIENNRIQEEALKIFRTQIGELTPPVPSKAIDSCCTKGQQAALHFLRKNVVHDKDGQWEDNAKMKMDNMWSKLKDENTPKVQGMCTLKLREAYKASMERKVEQKLYEAPGGHRKYRRDIEKLKDDFLISLGDFEEHEVLWAWMDFLKGMRSKETQIIQADDDMSLKEKEEEKRRNKERIKKLIKDHEKSLKDALKEQKWELKDHYREINKEREKQAEKDRKSHEKFIHMKLEKEQAEWKLSKLQEEERERKSKWVLGRLNDAIFKK